MFKTGFTSNGYDCATNNIATVEVTDKTGAFVTGCDGTTSSCTFTFKNSLQPYSAKSKLFGKYNDNPFTITNHGK